MRRRCRFCDRRRAGDVRFTYVVPVCRDARCVVRGYVVAQGGVFREPSPRSPAVLFHYHAGTVGVDVYLLREKGWAWTYQEADRMMCEQQERSER